MKILHTISDLSGRSGGTSSCTSELVAALNQAGTETDVLTAAAFDPRYPLLSPGSFVRTFEPDFRTPFGYSRNMRAALCGSTGYDLMHTNGMWCDINSFTAAIAGKRKIPYVISPHGMLYPQGLAVKPWRKRVMRALLFDRIVRNAACLHATCEQEWIHLRNLGFRNPVAVIPNPMSIPEGIDAIVPDRATPRIGFLGRFHPIKNIPALLEAWRRLGAEVKNAELLLIGTGEPEYTAQLQKIASEIPYGKIRFCGFVSGLEKYRILASMRALCVPSLQENFGMIVPEAWLMRTPVIASTTSPWEELNLRHCGWWVSNDPDTLAATIRQALHLEEAARETMGQNGYELLQEKYIASRVADQMSSVYRWLTGRGNCPDCVETP